MQSHSAPAPFHQPDVLTLTAGTWLAIGIVLFGLTPLPLHDATSGWSPVFWLVLAPALVLCARRLCAPSALARKARIVHDKRRSNTRRRSASNGMFTPIREHGEHRRQAVQRALQAS